MKRVRIIVTALMAMALVIVTALANIVFPKVTVRLADVFNVSVSIIGVTAALILGIKAISTLRREFQKWCDNTDKPAMKAMFAIKMAYDYGIDIYDRDSLEHGSMVKVLMNDVNWVDKFDKYKGQFGMTLTEQLTAKSNDVENEVDIYALLHAKEQFA